MAGKLAGQNANVYGVMQSSDGAIWAALASGGIVRLQDGEETHTKLDGTDTLFCRSLYEGPHGVIWAGLGHGLCRIDPAQQVAVAVYDVLGRRVAILFEGELAADRSRTFVWEAGSYSSGLYLIRVMGEHFTETRRVTLVK